MVTPFPPYVFTADRRELVYIDMANIVGHATRITVRTYRPRPSPALGWFQPGVHGSRIVVAELPCNVMHLLEDLIRLRAVFSLDAFQDWILANGGQVLSQEVRDE